MPKACRVVSAPKGCLSIQLAFEKRDEKLD